MAKDLAIILNNGTVKSAVATALAVQRYRPVFLYVDAAPVEGAGGGGSARARAAFDQQVAHYKPYREHALAMPFLSSIGGAKNLAAVAQQSDPRQRGPLGPELLELLPLLAVAARFAAHYGATAIYLGLSVGSRGDELAQATEYVQVWKELLQIPCAQPDLEVETPLLELEPWQVVDLGFQTGVPFERTWSCTEGDGGEPCWACRGCRAREAAFQQAGKADPLRSVRKV
jgi:7-cyano-7-deazaguanine synthase